MREWNINIFARRIDHDTGEVVSPSALFNRQLGVPTQAAMLDAGLSPAGVDSAGYTPLLFAVSDHPSELGLIERYLKLGAEVHDRDVDPIQWAADLQTKDIDTERLRQLIRLLVRYGSDPLLSEKPSGVPGSCRRSAGDQQWTGSILLGLD